MNIHSEVRANLSSRDWDYIASKGPGIYEIDGEKYRAVKVGRNSLELRLADDDHEVEEPRSSRRRAPREEHYDDRFEEHDDRYDVRDDDRYDVRDDEPVRSRSRRRDDENLPEKVGKSGRDLITIPPKTNATVNKVSRWAVLGGGLLSGVGLVAGLFAGDVGALAAIGVPVTALGGIGLYWTTDPVKPPRQRD